MKDRPPPRPAVISRRQLLLRAGALGATGLPLATLIAACRADRDDGAASTSGDHGSLILENWPGYIDPTRNGVPGTVDRFRRATGIDVRYTESYNDNNEYFAKIKPILGAGRPIEPDMLMPTYWMAARLRHLGWIDKLPLDQVPNRVNLDPSLRSPSWDPTGEYTMPWQSVLTGIAYNREATGRDLGSVADLFDPAFRGRIGMVTEQVDTLGLLLLGLGTDPSTVTTFEQVVPALERLEQAKQSGQIRAFTGNDYLSDLSTGNFAACIAWSGDVLQLQRDNPSVHFVIPEEGGMRATDTMVMPRGARHRSAAAVWMDFVYDPVQAARITAAVRFESPVEGVQEELRKTDPELAANPLVFPDAATTARLRAFADLDDDVQRRLDEAFARIVGA